MHLESHNKKVAIPFHLVFRERLILKPKVTYSHIRTMVQCWFCYQCSSQPNLQNICSDRRMAERSKTIYSLPLFYQMEIFTVLQRMTQKIKSGATVDYDPPTQPIYDLQPNASNNHIIVNTCFHNHRTCKVFYSWGLHYMPMQGN